MPVEHLYLLTATAFRLAVVLSGSMTTYLGYRLLLRGLSRRITGWKSTGMTEHCVAAARPRGQFAHRGARV
jgi:hypothetical protein